MSESLASSISESMHHQSSWYTSVQAGQKVDFSDVRFPKCYPGFCDKSTVSPHIRSEMIVVQSFCQAEPIPDVPPDRSVQGSDVVDQFQQCRVQAPVAGGSGLMSGASWTGTLLGFGVLGGSVVGFGRNKRRVV